MQAELGSQVVDHEPVLVHYAYVARYEYSDIVVQNDNFLMISPYRDQFQTYHNHDIDTIPRGRKVTYSDRLGNTVHRVRVTVPHQELIISAIGEVCLTPLTAPVADVSLQAVTYG